MNASPRKSVDKANNYSNPAIIAAIQKSRKSPAFGRAAKVAGG
jgi:hypothetical protein